MNAELFNDLMPQSRDHIRSSTVLGRVGIPGNVGEVIAFLASDAAAFISGGVIPIDGGYRRYRYVRVSMIIGECR